MSRKSLYFFGKGEAEGNASPEMVELLGGKGAHLHEMTAMGLPVPPGFTISTEVCAYYFNHDGRLPDGLLGEVREYTHQIEQITGSKFGDTTNDPLLVSARSGAAVSMPGMMETILNLGLTDKCVSRYIERHGSEEGPRRFILDCYRRLFEMFGENVYGISKESFRFIFDSLKAEVAVLEDTLLTSAHLEMLVGRYRKLYQKNNRELPQDPFLQLEAAIRAVEESAMGEKARSYVRDNNLPEMTCTGVNVQTMVYGNENNTDCGTGVGFTRDPVTGIKDREDPYGEFLLGGQGEDVVSGRRNVFPIKEMKKAVPVAYEELMRVYDLLEEKTKMVQDCEFTVWRGRLYMLQTRDAKLTGRANIRSSYDMLQEGLVRKEEAILRVTPENMSQLLHKMIDYNAMEKDGVKLADVMINPEEMGVPASPGGGVGRVVFDVNSAKEFHARGEPVILCRLETDPADYDGMVVSQAVVTSRGGKTSHAAVVARNKGIPCAVGTGMDISAERKQIVYRNNRGERTTIKEGDFISVDGSTGKVLNCRAALTEPRPDDPDLQNFLKLLYPVARMRVYANANDAEEAKKAMEFGAEGIGLARTEYMFLNDKEPGENRALTIQTWILSEDSSEAEKEALARLEEMQTQDFRNFYLVMQDKPVIIRLLDYPLHELLGDARDEKRLAELCRTTRLDMENLLKKIDSYREKNPMLGHRSVRLGITHPQVFSMQVRAILSAAREINRLNHGFYVTPHIEIPLVFSANEVKKMEELVKKEADAFGFKRGGDSRTGDYRYHLGIMYELSGAAFEADNLVRCSDFGSFGTNDLTQTVMGWSREDGSETFMPRYLREQIIRENPFISIDRDGPVAKAMALTILLGKSVKPDYEFGICGEHAADPASLEVCYDVGLTNVSPGPNQVPIAWLSSAQMSLTREYGSMLRQFAQKCQDCFRRVVESNTPVKSGAILTK
ncbi:MAG: pyruvate, phosphate dikinase [Chloroflexota bacterium]